VPIWVSGRVNDRVLDRLVRFGAGWIPWGDDAVDPGPGVRRIRDALAEAGRDPSKLGVVGSLRVERDDDARVDPVATMAPVGRMADAGITDFRLQMSIPTDHARALDELSALVEAFRAVV
jgi:alkanesulfonate monooxygenase SsuD/methylene tetrahydromethanopterin reductase-like flavin-dependent oxidoreductase (luciferase family)